jgi:hypothetical protein
VERGLSEGLPPRFGAFLPTDRVAAFDATAFGLSAPEAAMMDPQQRLVMELAWEALASSSSSSSSQPRSTAPMSQDVGVFVGVSTPDYADLKKAHTPIGVYSATGKATAGSRVTPDRQTDRQAASHALCHGGLEAGATDSSPRPVGEKRRWMAPFDSDRPIVEQ